MKGQYSLHYLITIFFRFIENGGIAGNQCGITFPRSQVANHSTNCNYSALKKQSQAVEVRLGTLPKEKCKLRQECMRYYEHWNLFPSKKKALSAMSWMPGTGLWKL